MGPTELRCPGRIHGRLTDNVLEVKCHSRACGARSGTVVLHYFDIESRELISTKKFQDATRLFTTKKEKSA